ncbi:MAG TPA: hypothetical protein VG937_12275 [Polyangiaceae bacterium]|nr:hypothetical protein [Polyangiaceae bacterium]
MKRLHSLLFVVLISLSAWVVGRQRAARPTNVGSALSTSTKAKASRSIHELVLPGAALIASLDLGTLRRNVWGRAALERLLPSEAKTEACARSALGEVERLVLAIPSASSVNADPEFAVLAEGKLQAPAVLECATRVLRARSGEPTLSRQGTFQCLRDKKGLGELAVRSGGPLILSGGGYFRALLERAEGGPVQNGPREELHLALRRELGSAPLRVTWLLPAGWLEAWLEDPAVKSSPLADVRAVSVRGELDDVVALGAVIAAENDASAARIEAFLRAAQVDFRDSLDAYLGPGASQQINVARSGSRVELSLRLGTRTLAARWLAETPPAAPSSHPVGSAHAEQREPDRQRAPRGAAHDQP